MIVCNGSSKTGTHLLLKAVYLFGGGGCLAIHRHDPLLSSCIHIKRRPKNVLISYIRNFSEDGLTTENIIKYIPIVLKEIAEYKNLLSDNSVLNVSFEKLLTDPSELKRISDFINIPLADNHFKDLWGNTSTFTGSLSNWRDHWNDEIQSKWVECGGENLSAEFGYNDNDKQLKRLPQ
tara:strand:+ start:156 stop:689 length:534 start_codon:yes stop_codon:yes gene_type:complete